MDSDNICIGCIRSHHALNGGMKVRLFLDDDSYLKKFDPLLLDDGRPFEIQGYTVHKRGLIIVKVKNCSHIDSTAGFIGHKIFALRKQLPKLETDEFYRHQLIGLSVLNVLGEEYGTIKDTSNFGAGDIVELITVEGKIEIFPFTPDVFVEVNLESGTAILDAPEVVQEYES